MSQQQENSNSSLQVLQLIDPETQRTFSLLLSAEDCRRAQEDVQFATSLLFHAKCTAKNVAQIAVNTPLDEVHSGAETVVRDENDVVDITEEEHFENVISPASTGSNYSGNTIWGYNEVIQLIESFNNHKDDLTHPKKRKDVFENVANDLISAGCKMTAEKVKNKWKSLVRSYNKAKDNKTRTGTSPSRFQFFNVMDDILGQKPSNACAHSLNSSIENINAVADEPEASCSGTSTPTSENNIKGTVPQNEGQIKRVSKKLIKREYAFAKKDEYTKRQKRHEEKVDLEREKIELEKRKLQLLEKYLNQQNR